MLITASSVNKLAQTTMTGATVYWYAVVMNDTTL
jgi:hypothetical protein